MEEEQPSLEPPVGARPPLGSIISMSSSWHGRYCIRTDANAGRGRLFVMYIPCVTLGVNSREGHTAILNVEVRLILQVQCTFDAGRDGLGKAYDSIMIDYCAAIEGGCNGNAENRKEGGCNGELHL